MTAVIPALKNVGTVRRYLNRSLLLAPLLTPYQLYLRERWNSGFYNASQLLGEIRQQGFAGQFSIVREFISKLRRASGLPPRKRHIQGAPVELNPVPRSPTPRARPIC